MEPDNLPSYYHVNITTWSHSGHGGKSEWMYNVLPRELERRFLEPYRMGETIVINGRNVAPESLAKISIQESKERLKEFFGTPTGKTIDVTNELIHHPAGEGKEIHKFKNPGRVQDGTEHNGGHSMPKFHYDVFISHASEDKNEVAEPLAQKLKKYGLRVWYDTHELRVGDSLRAAIDHGLAQSLCGVVIFSDRYTEKFWPQQELSGLMSQGKRIIPIWHKISKEGVTRFSPIMSDVVALNTENECIEEIAIKVADEVARLTSTASSQEVLIAEGPPRQFPLRDVLLYGSENERFGIEIDKWQGSKNIGKSIIQAKYHAIDLHREMDDIHPNARDRRESIIFGYLEPACAIVLEIAETNSELQHTHEGSAWTRIDEAINLTNAACADLMNHFPPDLGSLAQEFNIYSRPTGDIVRWHADRMFYCLLNVSTLMSDRST